MGGPIAHKMIEIRPQKTLQKIVFDAFEFIYWYIYFLVKNDFCFLKKTPPNPCRSLTSLNGAQYINHSTNRRYLPLSILPGFGGVPLLR